MTTSNATIRNPHDLNLIAAYIEHRLDEEERVLFERHLVTCTECREVLAAYARGSTAHVRAVGIPARPLGLGLPVQGWLALAASAVLAVGVSVYLGMVPSRTSGVPTERQLAPAVETPAAPTSVSAPAVPKPGKAPSTSAPRRTDLSKTRSSERHVGDKTFRLEAGTWVDTAYNPLQLLPATDVSTSEKRTDLLQEQPALKPYADLGPQVIVVFDGMVYRFGVR